MNKTQSSKSWQECNAKVAGRAVQCQGKTILTRLSPCAGRSVQCPAPRLQCSATQCKFIYIIMHSTQLTPNIEACKSHSWSSPTVLPSTWKLYTRWTRSKVCGILVMVSVVTSCMQAGGVQSQHPQAYTACSSPHPHSIPTCAMWGIRCRPAEGQQVILFWRGREEWYFSTNTEHTRNKCRGWYYPFMLCASSVLLSVEP